MCEGSERRLRSERGVTSTEYLVIAGVMVLAIITILGLFGSRLGQATTTISNCIRAAVQGNFGACGGAASTPAPVATGGAGPLNAGTGLPNAAFTPQMTAAGQLYLPSIGASVPTPPGPPTPGHTAAVKALGLKPGPTVAPDPQKVKDSARKLLKLMTEGNTNTPVSNTAILSETYAQSVGLDTSVRDKGEQLSDEAYQQAMDHVRKANALLRSNDTAGADAEIRQAYAQFNRSAQYSAIAEGQNANLAQQGMDQAAYVHEQAKNTAGVVSALGGPVASKVLDNTFRVTSFVVTSEMEGRDVAVKNLALDLTISAVINKGMSSLGGKTIKNEASQLAKQETQQGVRAITSELTNPAVAQETVATARAAAKDIKAALDGEGKALAAQSARSEAKGATQVILNDAESEALKAARGEARTAAAQTTRGEAKAATQTASTEAKAATEAAEAEANAAKGSASGSNKGAGTTNGPPKNYGGQTAAERDAAIAASGMPAEHAEHISSVAQANGQSIIIRDVSPAVGNRIKAGQIPKPMNVKLNTADGGLIPALEGAIPIKAGLNKNGSVLRALGGQRKSLQEKLKTATGAEASAIKKELTAVEKQIASTRNTVRYQDKLTRKQLNLPEGHPDKIYIVKDPISGKKVAGMRNADGKVVPLTGDYDMVGITGTKAGPLSYSPKTGYTTSSVRKTMYDINRGIKTASGKPVVPHGGENLLGVAMAAKGKPLKPNKLVPFTSYNADGSVTKVSTVEQFKAFLNQEHKAGRTLEVPPQWGWQGKPGSYR